MGLSNRTGLWGDLLTPQEGLKAARRLKGGVRGTEEAKKNPAGPTLGIHMLGGGTFNEERGMRVQEAAG